MRYDLPCPLGSEIKKYNELLMKGSNRTIFGNFTYYSDTSGEFYNTSTQTDPNILNKGEDGLFYWLRLDSVLGNYIFDKTTYDVCEDQKNNKTIKEYKCIYCDSLHRIDDEKMGNLNCKNCGGTLKFYRNVSNSNNVKTEPEYFGSFIKEIEENQPLNFSDIVIKTHSATDFIKQLNSMIKYR